MTQTQNITLPASQTKRAVDTYFGRLKHKRQVLTMFILLFIALIFWAIITLISSQKSTKIEADLLELAKPLTPVLKTEVLDTLETRRSFDDTELSSFSIFAVKTDPLTRKEVIFDTTDPTESAQ